MIIIEKTNINKNYQFFDLFYFLFYSLITMFTIAARECTFLFLAKHFFFLKIFKIMRHGWEVPASPTVTELLLPAGLRINFLMLPFQNIHSGPSGGWAVRMRAETESDGGSGGDGRGELGPGSLHLVGRLRASEESGRHTKLALCEISNGHQEGPTALFSQSEPVCFL